MVFLEPDVGNAIKEISFNLHPSFFIVYGKLQKWMKRFPFSADKSIYNDLQLSNLMTSKQFLDERSPKHLFRLVLSMHLMQKKILWGMTFSHFSRHLEIRWFSTTLIFPFSTKSVEGLMIGFNVTNRYEIFDEENIVLALQKHLPELRLVKDSFHCLTPHQKNLKVIYLELEKLDGTALSLQEQNFIKINLEEKIRKSIQTLSPAIFMRQTQEETYKNIIVLSNEITSLTDSPQVYITFETQTGNEIVFQIILVQVSPFHSFALKERFLECTFVLQRHLIVKSLDNHPVEAFIFSLHLQRSPDFLRSDGSLDFYAARQKVVNLITSALGEFRDFNGGIIVQQQKQLQALKERCSDISNDSIELLENFFYEISPLKNQIALPSEQLAALYKFFLQHRKDPILKGNYSFFKTSQYENYLLLMIKIKDRSLADIVLDILQENPSEAYEFTYNFIHNTEDLLFNCLVRNPETPKMKFLLHSLQGCLDQWELKKKENRTLNIGMEYNILSLDPRIGGEAVSSDVLRLLFEGLTRYRKNGSIENAIAKKISVSPCRKHYTFHLHRSFWNDGSPLTAYDFEYAWKKILSPEFVTSFAYSFHPIKNSQEAKEGKVLQEEIGIKVLDDLTLQVELTNPTPSFLQMTAHPLYSPVHRIIDQQNPQWSYQSEHHYPCNGPFQLKVNQPNQGFKLIKNPFYFDSHLISLKEITLTKMSPSQAFQAFQKNELDWIGNPLGSWKPFFSPGKDDRIVTFPNSFVCWALFNTGAEPFDNHKLRQALAHSIQRIPLTSDAILPLSPAFSPLLPQSKEHLDTLFPDYNPEIALKLLNEALEEKRLYKEDLSPINLIFHDQGILKHIAVLLKQQLEDCLGIKCELHPLTWNILFKNISSGNYQMGLMHWGNFVDDPIYTLGSFKSRQSKLNFSKWHNTQFERFIQLSDQEINPYQRSLYLLEAEKILKQEMPIVPLFYQPYQALTKNNLDIPFRTLGGLFRANA